MDVWRRDLHGITVVIGAGLDAAEVLAAQLRVEPASLVLAHSCPNCGSTSHGRPLIAEPAGARGVGISLARSQGVEAIAINPVGAVGVDLESIAQVARRPVRSAMLHPDEIAESPEDAASLWTAKEAILKLAGKGLRQDLRGLHVDVDVDAGRLVSWPAGMFLGDPPRIETFRVTDDLVATVAW